MKNEWEKDFQYPAEKVTSTIALHDSNSDTKWTQHSHTGLCELVFAQVWKRILLRAHLCAGEVTDYFGILPLKKYVIQTLQHCLRLSCGGDGGFPSEFDDCRVNGGTDSVCGIQYSSIAVQYEWRPILNICKMASCFGAPLANQQFKSKLYTVN